MSELGWIWIALAVSVCLVAASIVGARRKRLTVSREPRPDEPPAADASAPQPPASLAQVAPVSSEPRMLPVLHRTRGTRHPIVLAHGWGGIDRIGPVPLGYSYFRGIPEALRSAGHEVYIARVPATASIDLRAAALARQVRQLGERVNIIAHSMGGLDARLAIARYGLGERVASLTTIGTPHHGTPLVDAALKFGGEWRRVRGMLDRLGLNVDGMYEVTTQRMREFNRRVPNTPGVLYANVLSTVNLDAGGVHAMLAMGHRYLLRKAGPNDGLVPAISQLWGETLAEVDADHWAQIGWFGSLDVRVVYAQLAGRLREREL